MPHAARGYAVARARSRTTAIRRPRAGAPLGTLPSPRPSSPDSHRRSRTSSPNRRSLRQVARDSHADELRSAEQVVGRIGRERAGHYRAAEHDAVLTPNHRLPVAVDRRVLMSMARTGMAMSAPRAAAALRRAARLRTAASRWAGSTRTPRRAVAERGRVDEDRFAAFALPSTPSSQREITVRCRARTDRCGPCSSRTWLPRRSHRASRCLWTERCGRLRRALAAATRGVVRTGPGGGGLHGSRPR